MSDLRYNHPHPLSWETPRSLYDILTRGEKISKERLARSLSRLLELLHAKGIITAEEALGVVREDLYHDNFVRVKEGAKP